MNNNLEIGADETEKEIGRVKEGEIKENNTEVEILEIEDPYIRGLMEKRKRKDRLTAKEKAELKKYNLQKELKELATVQKELEAKDQKKIDNNIVKVIKMTREIYKIQELSTDKSYFIISGLIAKYEEMSNNEKNEILNKGKGIIELTTYNNPMLRKEVVENGEKS